MHVMCDWASGTHIGERLATRYSDTVGCAELKDLGEGQETRLSGSAMRSPVLCSWARARTSGRPVCQFQHEKWKTEQQRPSVASL